MRSSWNESDDYEQSNEQDGRAWKLVEGLAQGALKEQRRARRWGIFFKLLTFVWLFVSVGVVYNVMHADFSSTPTTTSSHTALVDLNGVIGADEVDADSVVTGLRAAFEDKGTKGVILRINSPGGSPVQSGYIYDEIRRLRELYPETPLYSVIMDIGASGGYYVAAAADKIYADKASLVGSIGVISSGFGFVEALEKLGVTRRVYTAGEHKAFNDPFQPQDVEATQRWQQSLDTIHGQFIDVVKQGRGDRLADNKDIFSGMVWTGEQAVELGLLDGLGGAGYVAREVIGEEEIIDFSLRLTPLERFARDFGAGVASTMVKVLGLNTLSLQ
ncbi:S49 family peptidase [Endozoicomonas sp. 4G]|uniref:S49 family peptidase n=1 Tax=Endozoicomonas sp. 4G TaxID=2872754 RepID=UPI0020791DEA|nr:S49 family peptidase [Endozoicomonas sp. 4G]